MNRLSDPCRKRNGSCKEIGWIEGMNFETFTLLYASKSQARLELAGRFDPFLRSFSWTLLSHNHWLIIGYNLDSHVLRLPSIQLAFTGRHAPPAKWSCTTIKRISARGQHNSLMFPLLTVLSESNLLNTKPIRNLPSKSPSWGCWGPRDGEGNRLLVSVLRTNNLHQDALRCFPSVMFEPKTFWDVPPVDCCLEINFTAEDFLYVSAWRPHRPPTALPEWLIESTLL